MRASSRKSDFCSPGWPSGLFADLGAETDHAADLSQQAALSRIWDRISRAVLEGERKQVNVTVDRAQPSSPLPNGLSGRELGRAPSQLAVRQEHGQGIATRLGKTARKH